MFLYLSQIRICQLEICGETRSRKEREMWGKFLFCATFPWMRNHLRVEMASSSLMLARGGKGRGWREAGYFIAVTCFMRESVEKRVKVRRWLGEEGFAGVCERNGGEDKKNWNGWEKSFRTENIVNGACTFGYIFIFSEDVVRRAKVYGPTFIRGVYQSTVFSSSKLFRLWYVYDSLLLRPTDCHFSLKRHATMRNKATNNKINRGSLTCFIVLE